MRFTIKSLAAGGLGASFSRFRRARMNRSMSSRGQALLILGTETALGSGSNDQSRPYWAPSAIQRVMISISALLRDLPLDRGGIGVVGWLMRLTTRLSSGFWGTIA